MVRPEAKQQNNLVLYLSSQKRKQPHIFSTLAQNHSIPPPVAPRKKTESHQPPRQIERLGKGKASTATLGKA